MIIWVDMYYAKYKKKLLRNWRQPRLGVVQTVNFE